MPYPVAAVRGKNFGNLEYWQIVRAMNPYAHWPVWESSGTTISDIVSGFGSGTLVNFSLGQAGIGDGRTSGSVVDTGRAPLWTTGFRDRFSGAVGWVNLWLKLANVGLWTDGSIDVGIELRANAQNYIEISKSSASNTLTLGYRGANVLKFINIGGLSTVGWMNALVTWSFAGNKIAFYLNGSQAGLIQTGLGEWAGTLTASTTVLGAQNTSQTTPFNGNLCHLALGDTYLSAAQAKALSWKYYLPSVVYFGDSVTAGGGASDAAHYFTNLITSSKGWLVATNAGISSTPLQNSIQNSVATIGGVVNNNGRDTYSTRVNTYNPTYVFILYGLNDIRLNDVGFTVSNYQNDLGEVIDGIIANGISASQIIIGSPPYMDPAHYGDLAPWNGGTTLKHQAYVAAAAAVAASKGTKYADIYQAMIDGGGDALMSADGIHPNDAGHAVIANAFLAVI